MKKIISLVLSLILVLSLALSVNADNSRAKGHEKTKTATSSNAAVTFPNTLDGLLAMLKSTDMNSDLKSKLINLIIDFRRHKGDNSIPVFFNNSLLTMSSPAVVRDNSVFLPASSLNQVAGAVITEGNAQLIAAIPGTSATYVIIDKKTGKITKNGDEIKSSIKAQIINRKLYIPMELFSNTLGFIVEYSKANMSLMIYSKGYTPPAPPAPPVLSAPTAVTVSPAGGTVIANTLNSTNTNMVASAAITAGQATGGKAELLVGTAVIAADTSITATDTTVTFDLGKTTNTQLQAAITSGGVVSVKLYNSANNTVTSSVGNPTLTVDYTAPVTSSAIFSNPTTITMVFSEAVNATVADFSDGKFIDANDGNNVKTFSVTAVAGSGSSTLTLTISPSAAIQTGDTGSIDIAATLKDLRGNSIVSWVNRPVASGF